MVFRGRNVFVKRDDQLEYAGVSASKLRKFRSLITAEAIDNFDFVYSYGGAQSNAMLALARLCKYHGKPFVYITRTISARLCTTSGNFRDALNEGTIHVQIDNERFKQGFTDSTSSEVKHSAEALLKEHSFPFPTDRGLFMPQGGAWSGAELGVSELADELRQQISGLRLDGKLANKIPIIFLPSGTGTTAYYLHKHISDVAKVVTVPVSGDERYLVKQMRQLHAFYDSTEDSYVMPSLPDVLRPRVHSTFADVTAEKLAMWKELSRATNGQIEFDLIYAPKTWMEIMLAISQGRMAQNGEDLIYYHSGGLEGNVSMLGKFSSFLTVHLLISTPSDFVAGGFSTKLTSRISDSLPHR